MRTDLMQNFALQEKVSELTRAQKVLIFVGTIVILAAAFYFLIYKEQNKRIASLQSAVTSQEQRLATLKQAAANVPALQKELAVAEEAFSRLLAFLPDQKEIPGLLENVSKLGSEVGLENILFQPQPEQPHEFYAVIPVRLDLRGTYHELGVFFDKVSKLNRILKVESLTMNRQANDSLLQVSCTIVTYRFLEAAEQGAKAPAKK